MNLREIPLGYKLCFWTIILVCIDQIVKMLIHFNLEVGESIEVFSWFNLCYVENNGFAFGMQLGEASGGIDWGKLALSLFRIAMIGVIIYGLRHLIRSGKRVPTGIYVGAILILAGAIGNMIDSAFYGMMLDTQDGGLLMGKVVDMIHLPLFRWENCPEWLDFLVGSDGYFFGAVFNIADAYISCAVVYLLIFQYKFFK